MVPRIADADPPGGAGKAIIGIPMPGLYQLRHGREEKLSWCRRATTTGQLGSENYRTSFTGAFMGVGSF